MAETYTPFRFRELSGKLFVTNEAGDYAVLDSDAVDRFFSGDLTPAEKIRFRDLSVSIEPNAEWRIASLMRRLRTPEKSDRRLTYLMVVPTLRCDLSCSYCQVSRAPLNARGFDWENQHLNDFERFIDGVGGDTIKLEFQGGEPTLRVDLLKAIIEICERKFRKCEFVVCSNMVRLTKEIEELYARDDVLVSTSIDGTQAAMTTNRTKDMALSDTILHNIRHVIDKYGHGKISALPTITEASISEPEAVVDTYRELGFQSIFLRPVNYMGFARKRHADLSFEIAKWQTFYERALEHIIDINADQYFDEFYLSMIVRSIFVNRGHGFVDFRSPSHFLQDYGVIDFDGKVYPSDEARMLSRIGHVDLSVGHMSNGIDEEKLAELNFNAHHQMNPDCIHCAYMPYCGVDVVDDMSRYNRIDLPKFDTWFCNRQTMLFDLIFSKVVERDRRWLDVFLKWIFQKNDNAGGYEVFGD